MEHTISVRWLANPNRTHGHLPDKFEAYMNIVFIIKVKILMLIEWS